MAGRPSSAITSRPGSGLRSRAGGSRPSSALEPERRSIPDDALEELEREIAEQLANDSGADMDHDKELGEPSQPRDLAHQIAAGQDGQMRTTYKGRCRYVYEPTYWDRFKDGLVATVKGVWSTRDTADDGVSAKQTVRTTLRELIVYIVFLAVLTVVTFGMSSSTMFYYTKIMTELFLDTQFADTKNTFRGLTSTMDLWRFAEGPLMDGLYWEDWYQDRNVSQNSEQLGYIFFENKLLGVPRIRQVKVKSDSCSVSNDFKDKISKCYGAYKKSSEDKNADSYYTGVSNNTNPFKYHSASDLGGFGYFGKLATYSTGGYVQNLGHTKANSLKKILELKNDHWIDRGTRAVFFDFTVYNANINLFCVVKLIVEFPATGGAIPSHTLHTVKLIRYVTAGDYFVLACEALYLLFIIYYTIEEIIEIKRHRFGYFRNFWNFLDLSLILVSYVAFIFNLYRTFEVNSKLDDLVHQPDDYPDFETLSWWTIQFNGVIAITVFIAWIKVFKYISFNRTMTQLSSTLSRCASDLAGFAVMFFIVFFAFAQLGYLIFGSQVLSFSSISDSIFTLFRVILGDFNFQELRAANRILGPIYFILYVFFVFFVLLNMFLAIINDTYTEVKEEIEHTKGDFSVGDYVLEGYKTVVDKLNVKRGKIADIQRVIQRGNTHMGQMNVDFEACRQDLKQRGYADAEIEAVLAKYDTNGDRVLDEEEQKRMQEDLDNEQAKLDAEMADLEEAENEEKRDENEEKVPYGEFKVLCKRVDSMENAIGNIMGKIDSVLIHLEGMEQSKMQRRQTISSILDSITSDSANDEERKENMERMIQQELEKFEEESVDGPLGESHGPNAAQGLSDVQESKETDSSTKGKKGSLKGKSMSTKVA